MKLTQPQRDVLAVMATRSLGAWWTSAQIARHVYGTVEAHGHVAASLRVLERAELVLARPQRRWSLRKAGRAAA